MKRVLIMVSLSLFPRVLVAQGLDVLSLVGEHWYGLYLNGQKAGYAVNAIALDDEGRITVAEEARFQVTMAGLRQDMRFFSKRAYAPEGGLLRIDSQVDDASGTQTFEARVEDDALILRSVVGGVTSEKTFPKPRESLADVVREAQLVGKGAKVGDELSFTVFEPLHEREIGGVSRIVGVEERIFEGAPTKVFTVKTTLDLVPIEKISHVAQDGTTLEDVIHGVIQMRLEPKEMAQNVDYSNDVIVANAAMVSTPITNPRTRKSLRLRLKGPLNQDHLFNDDRQALAAKGGGFEFAGRTVSLKDFQPARLPIENEEVKQWLEPSTFVQSDDARLVERAREIVGDETDSVKVSELLCRWVNENVRTTFSARLTNAVEVLTNLEGDCTEHSILFIGLARAAGLPAREVAGLVYVQQDGGSGFYFHQWAKVWVGKWIDVDPTFNQPLADVTHIKLAEGDLFEQYKLIPVIGRIQVEVLDERLGS